MKQKAVTVKDIANYLQISLSTVNKALTGKPGISEARRQEVLEVAHRLGYQVNFAAQALSRRPMHIGAVFHTVFQSFWQEARLGLEEELKALQQWNVTYEICDVGNRLESEQALERLLDGRADAVILCTPTLLTGRDIFEKLNRSGIPVFLLGGGCPPIQARCTIGVDSGITGNLAADLITLALHSRDKLAVFTASKDNSIHTKKVDAFASAVHERGFTLAGIYETQDEDEIAAACVRKLYRDHPDVRGIYITSASGKAVFDYVRGLPQDRRPIIVATDIYNELRAAVADGIVQASIYQNQELMGRLAAKTAYDYLLSTNSYQTSALSQPPTHLNVIPKVYLRSNIAADTREYLAYHEPCADPAQR